MDKKSLIATAENGKAMNLTYQLLALDPSETTRCEKATSLLHFLLGFTRLWKSPKVSEPECRITDKSTTLSIVEVKASTTTTVASSDDFGRMFILTLIGPYTDLEPLRKPLAEFLKDQKFELLYVLRDEVSEHIACELYPHLYRIENLLRGYLIRFMSTHIGPGWWDRSVSSEVAVKAKMRKKNELDFGKHVESGAYLIDFVELGEIVYEQSSGFLTREDIVARVEGLPKEPTPAEIEAFKQELQSNYQKLFKASFADKDFKNKWKKFEVLRNKIAHSNLFTAEDLVTGKRLAAEITEILTQADTEAQKLVITNEEREAIQEQVIAKAPSWGPAELTEERFLQELEQTEARFSKRDMFVGLTHFINNILIPKGFSYISCRGMIDRLKKSEQIEVYYVTHPTEPDKQTAAIRSPKPAAGG